MLAAAPAGGAAGGRRAERSPGGRRRRPVPGAARVGGAARRRRGGRPTRQFAEPHRRAEVLVAAFLQTLVTIWAGRLEPLRADRRGLDADRVAEEGVKSARHLLGMAAARPGLPAAGGARVRRRPRRGPHRRPAARARRRPRLPRRRWSRRSPRSASPPPPHPIVDEDGVAAPTDGSTAEPAEAAVAPDPDADPRLGVRYEHLNLAALRTSPEEVYQFIWNNAAVLRIDVRLADEGRAGAEQHAGGPGRPGRHEVLADYVQTLHTTADEPACRHRRARRDGAGHGRRAVGRRGAGLRPVRPVPAAPAPADPRRRPPDPPAAVPVRPRHPRPATAPSVPPTASASGAGSRCCTRGPTDDRPTHAASASGSTPSAPATACCSRSATGPRCPTAGGTATCWSTAAASGLRRAGRRWRRSPPGRRPLRRAARRGRLDAPAPGARRRLRRPRGP